MQLNKTVIMFFTFTASCSIASYILYMVILLVIEHQNCFLVQL